MNDTLAMPHTLSVVPIFVNAGTAILPAILAPMASALALLFKPKELIRTFRRRPTIPVVLLGIGVGTYFLIAWAISTPPKAKADPWVAAAIDYVENGGMERKPSFSVNRIVARAIDYLTGGRGVDPPGPTTKSMGSQTTTAPAENLAHAVVFRYGFSRCGYDGGPAPLGLKVAWRFTDGDGMFLSSPAVVGKRVYAATTTLDPIANENYGSVVCLDATNRRQFWRKDEHAGKKFKPFFSSPAVTADGKYVLIGQGLHNDADCDLTCFDALTGNIHWQVKTPLHIEGSPAILGDMVVAGAGAIEGPDHRPTTHIGMVLAVRISDGKELWRYDVNDPESSPAIDMDGTVYIGSGFQGNAVVALRSQTDEELKQKGQNRLIWRAKLPYPMTGAITLVGDTLYAGGGNGDYVVADPHPAGVVVALDKKTGNIRWSTPMPDSVLGAVSVADGKVICPVHNGEVFALNAGDGKPIWRQRVSGKAPVLSAPAFTEKYVYAVSRDGYLAVLDAKDGKQLQIIEINDPNKGGAEYCFSSPMIAYGCVFVGSESGGLVCLTGESK